MQQRDKIEMQHKSNIDGYINMRFLEYATKAIGFFWALVRVVLLFVDKGWLHSVETGLLILLIVNVAFFIEESRRRFAIVAMFMREVKRAVIENERLINEKNRNHRSDEN